MWASLVELVRATFFAGAHLLGGSLGASIILETLKPQLERIQKRFANDSAKLWAETQALQRANGIRMFTGPSVAAAMIQMPLLGALFSAVRNGLGARVRFLWIADLRRADVMLVMLVASVGGVSAAIAPAPAGQQGMQRMMILFAMGASLAFLWSASSAVALSVGAGSLVSVLQNWILARDAKRVLPLA